MHEILLRVTAFVTGLLTGVLVTVVLRVPQQAIDSTSTSELALSVNAPDALRVPLLKSTGRWTVVPHELTETQTGREAIARLRHCDPDRKWLLATRGDEHIEVLGDMIYRIGSDGSLRWTWNEGLCFTDRPVIDSQGHLYVIGTDLLWASIDSETGREEWRSDACGAAYFTQIGLLRDDYYFVVTDMTAYREKSPNEQVNDEVAICKADTVVYQAEIPPGAHIVVRNGDAYSVSTVNGNNRTSLVFNGTQPTSVILRFRHV